MEESIISAAFELITPVLESATILAAQYSKNCDRSFVTAKDMQYAMRYCTRTLLGRQRGTLFPEIYENMDEDSDEEFEIVEETEDSFTRYSGDDKLMNDVNEAYDTWESWTPYSPMEKMLKDAIDKNLY
jgi:hypothetical protein